MTLASSMTSIGPLLVLPFMLIMSLKAERLIKTTNPNLVVEILLPKDVALFPILNQHLHPPSN